MRLLNTETLLIENFFEGSIPKYAILSHTWGEEEVTFQDIQLLNHDGAGELVRQMKGFSKVKNSTKFAKDFGYNYIWIDTCCIDKTSSAELSEAINSMYKWYRESAICYAILSDVEPTSEEAFAAEDSSFRRSRWFTRGWTLQELIAPKELLFMARDWSKLCYRQDPELTEILSELTGVPVAVLKGRLQPRHLSVASRMTWVATRQTTRSEDIAYCLLGIFGVNMPLLYGEGQSGAFLRLQEAILKKSSDQSLFAWTSSAPELDDPDAICGLFAESPSMFKEAGNIEALPPSFEIESVPVEMTSHGLRVQLYLRLIWDEYIQTGNEDYYALLDCVVKVGTQSFCPTLRLRRLGYDQFGRLQQKSLELLPPVDYRFPVSVEGYQPVYVRQNPTYHSLPSFACPDPISYSQFAGFAVEDTSVYTLEEVCPEERWNPTIMTLTSVFSRSTRVIGLFRYRRPGVLSELVDVAVGLMKVGGFKWDAWCFQRRCQGDTLSAAFERLVEETDKQAGNQKGKPSHWFSLQSELGEDAKLPSDARIQMAQVHGRNYAYLYVFSKPEICTSAELDFIPEGVAEVGTASTNEGDVRILTERFSVDEPLLLEATVKANTLRGVRRRPVATDVDTWLTDWVYRLLNLPAQHTTRQNNPRSAAVFLSGLTSKLRSRLRPSASSLFRHRDGLFGDTSNIELLFLAALHDEVGELKWLLDSGTAPDSSKHGWTALHIAAAMGNQSSIRCILQHSASRPILEELINARTEGLLETPLHLTAAYAPREHQIPCFQLISSFAPAAEPFAHLIQRNTTDETLVHRAAVSDNAPLIHLILEAIDKRNASHNRDEELHSMVETYRATFVRQVDYKDRFCRTPLWHAAAVGSCEAISLLVGLGADLNFSDDEGFTPLHAASREGKTDAVDLLISLGAAPNTTTPYLDFTPLHFASLCGHVDCVRLLIAKGAEINSGIEIKPIHLAAAAENNSMECVRALTDAGAWCNVPCKPFLGPDWDGQYKILSDSAGSAAVIAEFCGHLDVAEHIKRVEEARAARQAGAQQQPIQIEPQQVVSATETLPHGFKSYGQTGGSFGRTAPFLTTMASSRARPAPGYGNLLARPPLTGPSPMGWAQYEQISSPNMAWFPNPGLYPQSSFPRAYNEGRWNYQQAIPAQSSLLFVPTVASGYSQLQVSQHLERELRAIQAHRDSILDQHGEGYISDRDATHVLGELRVYEEEIERKTRQIQHSHEFAFQNDLQNGAVLVDASGQPILELA
ncbi:hypothetical protein QBC38DRAFT_157642 [Podospora fimiseda]|uniref:Heterokaryon incompatibility domain-containing protein n=1 Tax=Podospora fimiseda TaxID=252190 RepID=A0AAN7BEK2_9PEZI|nr:hypothetical protein QBC38DRAFT_157642 [Podospora fimiseda]